MIIRRQSFKIVLLTLEQKRHILQKNTTFNTLSSKIKKQKQQQQTLPLQIRSTHFSIVLPVMHQRIAQNVKDSFNTPGH